MENASNALVAYSAYMVFCNSALYCQLKMGAFHISEQKLKYPSMPSSDIISGILPVRVSWLDI